MHMFLCSINYSGLEVDAGKGCFFAIRSIKKYIFLLIDWFWFISFDSRSIKTCVWENLIYDPKLFNAIKIQIFAYHYALK